MTPAEGRLVRLWGATRASLAGVVAPAECPVCGAESAGEPLCGDCRAEVLGSAGPACPRCAAPVGPWADLAGGCSACRGRPLGFDAATALGPYSGPIRDLCLRLKHRRDAWLARWLAGLLAEARGDSLRAEAGGDRSALVVPVPLHWRRRLGRGYNQAEALADALALDLGLRAARPIRRIKGTPRLAGLGRAERAGLIRGAFRARPGAALRGRTVLLVDDILTTGATCGSAARALKRAGAARVVAVVVARA